MQTAGFSLIRPNCRKYGMMDAAGEDLGTEDLFQNDTDAHFVTHCSDVCVKSQKDSPFIV